MLCGFGDADARRHFNALRSKTIVPDKQIGLPAGQVFFVVALAGDAEGLGEAVRGPLVSLRRSVASSSVISRASAISSIPEIGSRARNRTPPASPSGRQETLKQIMVAVDEVHISQARRTEEHEIARRAAAGGMGGRIVLTQVGFHFHDPRAQEFGPGAVPGLCLTGRG